MGRKNSKRKQQQRKSHQGAVSQLVKGTLELTRSGMGYVLVDQLDTDIMVRPGDLHTALHGDLVKVAVKERKANGRMQGVIKEIIKRKRSEFIGQLQMGNGFAFFVAETDKPMPDIFIPKQSLQQARQGDRVVVKVIKWAEGADKRPMGEVVTILKEEDGNDAAAKEILLEAGFPLSFSDEALEESARMPEIISQEEITKRRDCRSILTFTIDPVDAKDFDDAISFQKLPNGWFEIGVHIADVSHYVAPGTVLDAEAYARATSVYLPDRVNPMLPEHISNVLCSLRPQEEKLTFSAIFTITPTGQIKEQWLGRTVIFSDHRFTYEEVQAIIEEQAGLYAEQVLQLNQLARQFRAARFEQGAINFSSQEVRFKLNEKGDPIGIMVKESKESHQLIEEFMLLANRAVASFIAEKRIDNKPIPFPYRIHDDPDEEKLIPFVDFARKFGHSFDRSSPQAIASSFNQLLKDVKGRPEQHVLEQLGIRTMAKARYTAENVGHYGLGFDNYCHFTSPIRRYPDIQAHRILWEVLQQRIVPDKKLEEKCKHTSERERAAMEAERAANKYKQVQYMKNYVGEEFEGIISGVAHFGFWVETIEHKCEGLVSVASLSDYDDFRQVESDYCLLGMRSGRKFRMGDKVWIKVIAANLTKRQLDYEWVVAGELSAQKSGAKLPKTKK
ncbi:MAG: ribonuclease R [Sphingomonadales bacterium]|nr:ribonuclease R [Sphingomonadales bacterium]